MTQLSDRLTHASTLAKREMEEAYEHSREYQVEKVAQGVESAIAILRWGWIDPRNHQYIAAHLKELTKQRDELSSLIDNIEALNLAQHHVAAE